jgi:hypothetical protein
VVVYALGENIMVAFQVSKYRKKRSSTYQSAIQVGRTGC